MILKIFGPLLLLLLITPFTPQIDLYVSHLFYSEAKFYDNGFFHFLFCYGEQFGFFVSGCCVLIFFISLFVKKWFFLKRGALAMILTFVIGAGLVTNSLLKEHWGRPRPKQIEEFGGHHTYRPFWKPNFYSKNDPQKSFPSGHVAMGFYFLSLCLVGRRYKSKILFYSGCFLIIFLGGGLMVARVAQGGHFVSDVIISPILMWLVALFVDQALFGWNWDKKITLAVWAKKVRDPAARGISQGSDDVERA